MDLATARQIIQEQADYLATTEFHVYATDVLNSDDGNDIDEVVVSDISNHESLGIDSTKIYVDEVARFGGEGKGEDYWRVFKIDHPVHGVGYIKYKGQYDSWNGVEWESPYMVIPEQVMITEYVPV